MKSAIPVVCITVAVLAIGGTVLGDLNDDLEAYYPFTGNASDATGNGHDGTVIGATLTTDRFGNLNSAYLFDGTDDYVSASYSGAFQLSTFTLAAWIRPTRDLSPGSSGAVIAARGEDFFNDHLSTSLQVIGEGWGESGTVVSYEDSYDDDHLYATGIFPQPQVWTHVAATRSSSGEVAIYINGNVMGHWLNAASPATVTQALTIGARWYSPSGSGPYELISFFPGAIDDVAVYGRALSASEVAELYAYLPPSNLAPFADAGVDQIVEQTSADGAEVQLDGSYSSDPDGDALTYEWTWDGQTASGPTPIVTLSPGWTTVTLTVSDGELTATDTVDVLVQDTTPPEIQSIVASPEVLWPPDKKMVQVRVKVNATDLCDSTPLCRIVDVTSNEPIVDPGPCVRNPDWQYANAALSVWLKADRDGKGTGRVYTIYVMCMDDLGNMAEGTVDVTVPHDQANGNHGCDDHSDRGNGHR